MISTHTPGTQCPGPRPFQRGPGARLSVFFCRNYHLSSNKSPLNTAALSPLLKPRRGNQKDSHCLPSFQGSGLIFELTMPSPGHQGSVQSGKVELVFPGSVLVCSSCRPPWRTCWLGRVWSTGDWSHWKGNCGRNEATLRCCGPRWEGVAPRGPMMNCPAHQEPRAGLWEPLWPHSASHKQLQELRHPGQQGEGWRAASTWLGSAVSRPMTTRAAPSPLPGCQ